MPQEALAKMTDELLTAEARADPIWARRNWGLLAEQRSRAARLESEDSAPGQGREPTPGEIDPRLAGGGTAPQRG